MSCAANTHKPFYAFTNKLFTSTNFYVRLAPHFLINGGNTDTPYVLRKLGISFLDQKLFPPNISLTFTNFSTNYIDRNYNEGWAPTFPPINYDTTFYIPRRDDMTKIYKSFKSLGLSYDA